MNNQFFLLSFYIFNNVCFLKKNNTLKTNAKKKPILKSHGLAVKIISKSFNVEDNTILLTTKSDHLSGIFTVQEHVTVSSVIILRQ